MASDSRLRVACIGCGGNMRGHIGRLLKLKDVELVGLAEPFSANLDKAREQFAPLAEVAGFEHHSKLLAETKPDAVVISTPHKYHAEQILAGLDAGCHVLCEKPMTCTAAEAQSVCAAAEAAGKVVMVSYQRHWMPLFLWLRERLTSGAMGPLEYLTAQQYQSWADHFRNHPEAWRLSPEQSGGGQLNDSGSHLVDILLHITGLEPTKVSCIQQSFEFAVDINSSLVIEFAGGTQGSIQIVGGARGMSTAVFEDITLIGRDEAVYYRTVGQPGEAKLERRLAGERTVETDAIELPEGTTPDEAFIQTILGVRPNEAPPECGLRTIKLSEAAWRSAAAGGEMVEV